MLTKLVPTAVILLALPFLSASAGEKPFPKRVPVLDGSYHEGFAIGKGSTAYSGSPDGSIYKVDLRNGKGKILVDAVDPDDCINLGMRVDRRSNYLFVAGCFYGNAYVYDADTGNPIMEYQLDDSGLGLINDLAITQDAVYFTDFWQPLIYRLPLSKNGRIPEGAGPRLVRGSPRTIPDVPVDLGSHPQHFDQAGSAELGVPLRRLQLSVPHVRARR
jgi:outer membrane protein assembly factor BamB